MSAVLLQARTHAPRHEASMNTADTIQAVGGVITDSRQFSNVGLMLRFEISAPDLKRLPERLAAHHVLLDEDSGAAVVDVHEDAAEVDVSLHLRFFHDEPDLRIPTPHVPG